MASNQYYWNIESLWEKYYSGNASDVVFSCHDILKNLSQDARKKYIPYDKKTSFQETKEDIFFDEHNIGYKGLQNFSFIEKDGKAIFIVDNHHQVLPLFYGFYKALNDAPIRVVHIDAHRDDAIFPESIEPSFRSLPSTTVGGRQESSFPKITPGYIDQITSQCRVSDYLDAGEKIGIIGKIENITQSNEFEDFRKKSPPEKGDLGGCFNSLLNLDIDIFGPEGTAVSTELKTRVITKAWENASVVCIATSPGFIDKEKGEKIIKLIV